MRRSAFTLIEMLVVIAIIIVLVGLLMPAVQKVREAGNRAKCGNNLRQVGLAVINCNTTAGKLPSVYGSFPGIAGSATSGATLHFYLLPYLEQGNLYQAGIAAGNPEKAGVGDQIVPVFICPADASPTTKPSGASIVYGPANYQPSQDAFGGPIPTAFRKLQNDFPDGTSNTIIFGERLKTCGLPGGNTPFPPPGLPAACWPSQQGGGTWADYTHEWNYYQRQYTGNGGSPTCDTAIVLWQQQPRYDQDCNPYLYNSPHSGGMNVLLADGHLRFVNPGMSAQTWEWALIPNDGHTLGPDW